jgi:hypothetical protein
MPRCPLCENEQAAGEACEVCGRPLAPAAGTPAASDTVPGLEPTRFEAVAEAGAALEGLEPTALAPAGEAAAGEAVPGLEPTGAGPVPAAAPEAVEGFEPTAAGGVADDGPTPEPLVRTCRYCRTPAPPSEVLCGRCGMRLPGPPRREAAPASPAPVVCWSCGTPLAGGACPACGARRS